MAILSDGSRIQRQAQLDESKGVHGTQALYGHPAASMPRWMETLYMEEDMKRIFWLFVCAITAYFLYLLHDYYHPHYLKTR